jgi:hypothetical protein
MITRPESTRDAGLALISRVTRWLIAGAVALSGFISIAAANAFHGHTVSARSAPASNSATIGQAHSQPPPVNDQSLQQPEAAPAPSPAPTPAPVVSGGS